MTSFPLVVFISGTGSNLDAILSAIDSGRLARTRVEAVIADCDAPGLEYARRRAIPTHVITLSAFPTRKAWDEELAATTSRYAPRLVVLAGFMKLLGAPMLERFGGRIINTHPALLPSFPGAHGVRDALAHGVKITGATVIEVDEGVDTGVIIDQRAVRVEATDTETTLHERIKEEEREMLIEVIDDLSRSDTCPS